MTDQPGQSSFRRIASNVRNLVRRDGSGPESGDEDIAEFDATEAPVAIDSPKAVQTKVNGTNNVVNNNVVGPWLIVLTAIAVCAITLTVNERINRKEITQAMIAV